MGGKKETKAAYFEKLEQLLKEYKSIFIVTVDNVSSQQMHEIRQSLRGEGVVLMGKNTMVRRALKGLINDSPEYERLLPHVKGNVGFVFTNADLKETRDKILANRVAAPARAGAVAPGDVYIPAGNTGMEPGKTSFFQALGVPTKIARGTIEITSDLKLIEAGNKVGASEATLLNLLNISPFTYGMGIYQIYDNGQTFEASAGAHTIGTSHCSSFTDRLYNFSQGGALSTDPALPAAYAALLKEKCPPETAAQNDTTMVQLDDVTPFVMDNQYYKNLLAGMVPLGSDVALMESPDTAALVELYAREPAEYWAKRFVAAMVKVSEMEVLTGAEGEIRLNCSKVN